MERKDLLSSFGGLAEFDDVAFANTDFGNPYQLRP